MINEQWLKTFMTLVEVGHFTKTAEKLFMTQPGVSQHIKKLEQQLEVELLNRVGKRFELTGAGIELFNYGQTLKKQQQQLLARIGQDEEGQGECRIGSSGSMASLLYPYLIELQLTQPRLTMHLEAGPNHRTIEGIKQNHLDLGLLTQQVSDADIVCEQIGIQPLCLVLPKTVKGKQLNPNIEFAALKKLGMITHPDGAHYWQKMATYFFSSAEQAESMPIQGYVNQLNQILLPVAKGLGFTVLPEFALRSFDNPKALQVAILDENHMVISEPLFSIYKRYRPLPRRYKSVLNQVRQLVN